MLQQFHEFIAMLVKPVKPNQNSIIILFSLESIFNQQIDM